MKLLIVVNLTYLILMCSMLLRNLLWVRVVFLLSSGLSILTNFWLNNPMGVFWNIVLLLLNIVQIFIIIRERSAIILPANLRGVYHRLFSRMLPRDFLYLYRLGKPVFFRPGETLIHEGKNSETVFLLLEGMGSLEKNKTHVCDIEPYVFLGEMQFVSGAWPSATIKAKTTMYCLAWEHTCLMKLEKIKEKRIYDGIYVAICINLADKIREMTPSFTVDDTR